MTATEMSHLTKGNMTIAKYDGWVKVGRKPSGKYKYKHPDLRNTQIANTWAYHKDWNWLIPAATKCVKELQQIQGEEPNNVHEEILGTIESAVGLIEMSVISWDIKKLWEAVVYGVEVINKYKEDRDL